jgi:hypothetical protein
VLNSFSVANVNFCKCVFRKFDYKDEIKLKSTIFWYITPCSPFRVNRRFVGTYHLHLHGRKINKQQTSVKAGSKQSPGYLKMEAICSTETSVDIQRTTRRYIPEDSTLYNHRCENLKSYILVLSSKVKCFHISERKIFGKVMVSVLETYEEISSTSPVTITETGGSSGQMPLDAHAFLDGLLQSVTIPPHSVGDIY